METEVTETTSKRRTKAAPEGERKCVVCRADNEREVALHFVRSPDGHLAFDVRRKLKGRGVNVCPRETCVKKLRPGLPGIQALGELQPLGKTFYKDLGATLEKDVLDQLGLLVRQKSLTVGAVPTVDGLLSQKVHMVFLASDVAERSKRDVKDAIHKALDNAAWSKTEKIDGDHAWQRNSNVRNPSLVILPTTMQGLGRALGREVVGVVACGEDAFPQGKKGERAMTALMARAHLSQALLTKVPVVKTGETENG